MASQVHWFPGHMKKALKEIEDRLKVIDVVIELIDARAPISSINPQLEKTIKNKKRILVLTKIDLADPLRTEFWVTYLKTQYDVVLALDITQQSSIKVIEKAITALGQAKREKEKSKGMKPQPIRTMIIGVPNVGKSSLINRLARRKAAGVQNKPGFTRGEQWIKVSDSFLLLDTPGILPMNYDEQKKATHLALVGSVKEDILPNHILVNYLSIFLKHNYSTALQKRFNIYPIGEIESVLQQICQQRSLVDYTGGPDLTRAEILLLKEFKDGLLGRITLDIEKDAT
ncbi:MAG: ribosome biogenesis GTPase YlqF [Erysipelotrichaceae bacterium]|jgi:ribosome biogenesis GTPase A|nr:ribosome biogenesis GTPase YlqF [Bacilli bacterium]NLV28968.1 ribosome biogenesis GTPase YlqF [Erysipelotrichaceae bacterium]HPY79992.1 ribosome biogenesis GTPase YlqF [Bacilli bacterium]HQA56082.1 ribosome biogenesis GTPase YlqF [Bacilli bacterium]